MIILKLFNAGLLLRKSTETRRTSSIRYYVSLFPSVDRKYTYEEAKTIALEALKPMGQEYVDAVKRGFDNRWIDVYELRQKEAALIRNSSGAGPHPFIL